jgi:hypothetical protein
MTIKERIVRELRGLSEANLKQVAEYVAFLKFRERAKEIAIPDEAQLAALYAEFADEDRDLAEEELTDYTAGLAQEDKS